MNSEKVIKILFIVVFFSILAFFGINTLLNDQKVSLLEKRNLERFPKFELKELLKSDYYDKLSAAHSDQLEKRNYLVKGYFLFQFQRYYGGVVKGKNKQIYSSSQKKPTDETYKELANSIKFLNEEASKINAKIILLSVPRKDAYMTKELPKTYSSSKDIYEKQVKIVKENLSDDIIFIDAMKVFKDNNMYYCYYSNDHHTTPKCSYYLYKEINKYTSTKSYDLESEFTIGKTIVKGSFNDQLGQSVKSPMEDLYLIPKNKIKYTRYENDKLSNRKVYKKGNTYKESYMGGDFAYTKILTNKNTQKNIMFVGSSYTNILEALSIPSYNKMISIDYRHNKTGNKINYYVLKNDIDYVVLIPAQSNDSFMPKNIKLHLGY